MCTLINGTRRKRNEQMRALINGTRHTRNEQMSKLINWNETNGTNKHKLVTK